MSYGPIYKLFTKFFIDFSLRRSYSLHPKWRFLGWTSHFNISTSFSGPAERLCAEFFIGFWNTLGRGYALHLVGVKFLTVNLTFKPIHLTEKTMSYGLTKWLQNFLIDVHNLFLMDMTWDYGRWVHLPERAGGHVLGPPTGHSLILQSSCIRLDLVPRNKHPESASTVSLGKLQIECRTR